MKKYLFLLACALFTQSFYAQPNADTAINEDEKVEVPHRKAYAYFQSNFDFGKGEYGIGSFYLDTPNETTLEYSFATNPIEDIGTFAGAVANGIFYGCAYKYVPGSVTPKDFFSFDLKTGERKDIGPWTEDIYMKGLDMTYNYADKTMYLLAYNPEILKGLFTIDMETGKATHIIDIEKPAAAIAANYEGQLYVMGRDGCLYSLDKETGKMTEICKTEYKRPDTNCSLEFDHTDGNLYWIGTSFEKDKAEFCHLIRFNMNENPVTFDHIGTIASETSDVLCHALYIPFVLGGEYAPVAPSEFSISPNQDGKLEATLRWTNPVKDFNGRELKDLSSITVLRDGEEIANIPTDEIGGKMEWTDKNVPQIGEHEYSIYANNNAGEGEKTTTIRYIGMDSPKAVDKVSAKIKDSYNIISLEWSSSNGGQHGSYCNKDEVSYKIIRYPDEVVVAENLKDTIFNDKDIKRLARYHYAIYAVNNIGENETLSNYIVAGPAMDMPYSETFSDNNISINQISFYDSNNDFYGWQISSGWGYYQFGDRSNAVEYFVNPTFTPSNIQSTDEWFITPPLKFEGGRQYSLTFDYRSITNENVEITTGENNSIEAQKIHETIELEALEGEATDFTKYTTLLPAPAEDCIQCIGFHLTTPFPEDRYSFLQITNIEIKEYVSVDKAELKDMVTVKAIDGNIIIKGQFNEAEVYSADGMKVASTSENIIPAGTLEKGLYLVRVMKDNKAETFKVML